MSAHIVLTCDRKNSIGKCAASVRVFDVESVTQAWDVARKAGWHRSPSGQQCPRCAGTRDTNGPPVISGAQPP